MDPFKVFLFLFISILLSHTSIAQDVCNQVVCGENQPFIRFPFRIAEHQPERCGYPGFDLRCSSSGKTVIKLPSSGEFFVREINYLQQEILLYDPDNCLRKRLLELDLSDSPFQAMFTQNYTFLNCSDSTSNQFVQPIGCLSSPNHTVLAIPSRLIDVGLKISSCKPIKSVLIPTQWPVQYSYGDVSELSNDILLNWREPNCGDCESRDGNCRFRTNDSLEIGCFNVRYPDTSIAQDVCNQVVCGENQPVISFPFRIAGHQPESCGYPGFDLRCSSSGETVINLPSSGEFFVRKINYLQQAIRLYDPDSCLPKRLLEFDLSDSPFQAMFPQNYTFLNCSDSTSNQFDQASDCLSSRNHTVMAIPSTVVDARLKNSSCKPIKSVLIPTRWRVQFSYGDVSEFGNDILLNWREPNCVDCESFGGNCRFNTNDPLEIGCFNFRSPGEPRIRTTKLPRGLALGLGLPILLLTVILGTYFCIRVTAHVQPPPHIVPSSSAAVLPQPVVVTVGLDRPTIESYPKVVLGESRRLPRPDDSTCSICLSDYKPKETLRSIPECQHFFHADCIDRWLHLNSSCPVCRKSPQTEANAT